MGGAINHQAVVASYVYAARYRYSGSVIHNDNQLRLFPAEDQRQSVIHSQVWTVPEGRGVDYRDRFGNRVHRVRVTAQHDMLVVATAGQVSLTNEKPAAEDVSMYEVRGLPEAFEYTSVSPLVDPGRVSSVGDAIGGRVDTLLSVVLEVVDWVYNNVRYQRGSTGVTTRAEEVLAAMEGVCQDKTHLALGILRSLGVPCRYVSGLLTGQTGETHSWLEFLHPQQGWLPADPTRGVLLPPARDYIRLAVGRDYTDVSPVSGSFLSKGEAVECAAIAAVRLAQTEATLDDALELLDGAYVVRNTAPEIESIMAEPRMEDGF